MRDLIKELEKFSADKNMSYGKIAKAMGIGQSTLSEVRNGTYKGDPSAVMEKIKDFLERHKEKMRRINFSCDTDVRKRVFYAIDLVKKYVASNVSEQIIESAKIAYIVGRAGIGKTHALREYARTYKAKCIFITAENNITDTVLVRKVAKELGIATNGRTEEIKDNIKAAVKFTETLVIIDEGEHLKPKVIDVMRSIADQTGIGLVIAGTEKLKHQLLSQRGEYEYLLSRAATIMQLNSLSTEDVGKIVKKFLGSDVELYDESKLSSLINLISTTVKGSARQLNNLLTLASDIASRPENVALTDGLITEAHIKAATKLLFIV
ncbi:AAA family ATPase [Cetobacterium somerae]|uniref:AAA family ATPase n=1 Tax=Cetobacterium somerae TaxID=188913 RepID=UPI00211F260B|nr:AAA family ATPase [Cetobacterium somerae]